MIDFIDDAERGNLVELAHQFAESVIARYGDEAETTGRGLDLTQAEADYLQGLLESIADGTEEDILAAKITNRQEEMLLTMGRLPQGLILAKLHFAETVAQIALRSSSAENLQADLHKLLKTRRSSRIFEAESAPGIAQICGYRPQF